MPAPKLLALADVMRLYLDDTLPRGPTYWFAAAAAVAGCASFVAPFLTPRHRVAGALCVAVAVEVAATILAAM
jgi:hypothetical protein